MLKKFDKLYFLCYNLTCHETERMNHYMKKFIGAALVTLSITAVAAAASADSAGVVSADATYARQGAGDNFKAVETLSPTSSTMPTISWPTVIPGTARGTEPCLI